MNIIINNYSYYRTVKIVTQQLLPIEESTEKPEKRAEKKKSCYFFKYINARPKER